MQVYAVRGSFKSTPMFLLTESIELEVTTHVTETTTANMAVYVVCYVWIDTRKTLIAFYLFTNKFVCCGIKQRQTATISVLYSILAKYSENWHSSHIDTHRKCLAKLILKKDIIGVDGTECERMNCFWCGSPPFEKSVTIGLSVRLRTIILCTYAFHTPVHHKRILFVWH